jgi:aspartyl-tRNA(Asn)/glutamyl-tRNA(Gln) amidotransferase subunit B
MRSKEAANDYRYFPEPDLQPLFIKQEQIDEIKMDMPTLPRALFEKYTKEFGLSEYDAYNLTDNKGIAMYYEQLIRHTKNHKAAANWIMGDVKSYLNEFGKEINEFPLNAERIADLIRIIDEGKISSSIASQKIFPEMLKSEEPALLIAEKLNLIQDSSEDTLKKFILKVFEENKTEVERYKAGDKKLTGFFMGKLMKVSNGKADPKIANSLLRKMLEL